MAINNGTTRQGIQQTLLPSEEIFGQNDINNNQIIYSQLLQEVQNLLKTGASKTANTVDALQKLCIDHHFQEEIDLSLKQLYTRMSNAHDNIHDDSLYDVSSYFRILRQEGYYVPASVFAKFQENNGNFKREIAQDVKGLMAFYEASQLSIEGEHILEEAADFCRHIFKEKMSFLDQEEASMVRYTLGHSYQRTPSTFMVKYYIKHYMGTTMSELAILELPKAQSLHRLEVDQISRWWKDLGLAQEFMLARNQPLHWYIWPMAGLTDPSFSELRVELTKPIALIYVIDDIFDVYGNLDELIVFTEAVKRWDNNTLEQLPYHLRICIRALYDLTHEISDNIYKKYGYNPKEFLKQVWTNLCEAFLVEAKWFASGHMPMTEDYLKNGIVSSGAHVVIVHMFFLLGCGTSDESGNIINNNQGITSCVATILRLWDDLGTAKDLDQEGHDGSYVTYYMKENEGCSIQSAREHVMAMIMKTWKQLNKECLSPNQFSATFTKACLNLARTIPIMYNYDDNHSLPVVEDFINSMF